MPPNGIHIFQQKTTTMSKKQLLCRAYLLSKVREQGIHCKTHAKTIFCPYGEDPEKMPYVGSLISEFQFCVQFEMVA